MISSMDGESHADINAAQAWIAGAARPGIGAVPYYPVCLEPWDCAGGGIGGKYGKRNRKRGKKKRKAEGAW